MLNRHSLDPEHRALYSANLQPPAGYVFDTAVATTFSLDFETAFAVPVSLALFAAENRDELLSQPLALLEGAERIAGRLLIFTDSGQIQGDTRPHSRLCSLFERIVVEVAAPRGGAFHPKVWVLRYTPLHAGEPVRLRLIVLSRNLTRDRSWDIAATFDGLVTGKANIGNRPLARFLRQLPGLATVGVPEGSDRLVEELARDVGRSEWVLPQPFQSVSFAVNGFGGKTWQPEPCARLGVISPFCDGQTLSMLAGLASAAKPVLIGRSDQLVQVPGTTLDGYERVAVLDEMAVSEDGEDTDATIMQGLHAKAFIAERGWNTAITIGSGNATRPALLSGRNVELFATLTGKRSQVGSVEEILGDAGFGRLTRPFVRDETSPISAGQRAAEARLDAARRELCRSGVRLRCERSTSMSDGPSVWHLWLVPPAPLALDQIGSLRVWPITRGDGHACNVLDALRCGRSADLGAMPMVDLSRFLACHLTDAEEQVSIMFSTGLHIDGLPAERHAAILRRLIDSKQAFFRYLRLLLSELGDPFCAALAAQNRSGDGVSRKTGDDMPLLEEMVRSFCRGADQLRAIERMIRRLEADEDAAGESPVPAEFRELWDSFRVAISVADVSHDG